MSELEIKTRHDAQRLRCPRNHVVTPTNRHFNCRACEQAWRDVDSEFDSGRDAVTGTMVGRDDLRFRGESQDRVPA